MMSNLVHSVNIMQCTLHSAQCTEFTTVKYLSFPTHWWHVTADSVFVLQIHIQKYWWYIGAVLWYTVVHWWYTGAKIF